MTFDDVVICSPLRTPVGRFGGVFADLSATDLASGLLRELAERTGLGEGDVDDVSVECWKHGARFDVRTGKPLSLPATRGVVTYPVTLDGEVILVDVDTPTA